MTTSTLNDATPDGLFADGSAEAPPAGGGGTHLVLARKWRPRRFDELVGQDLVVRALRHALDSGRIHHAYLLTGTRGVGKTTIARIIAKALNCERGPSADPCGRCGACTGIDAGRYPDYIEMDAASNRKVEEMAAVLETAAYAPSSGRYKVFVIDEVHMLSNYAFNAMLKTLEEPPPHVVFVLATTDPQKVPVTVLSRCLQFSLRAIVAEAVAAHLERVLQAEQIAYDRSALVLIGRAGAGSLRDALSLLDQAIAVGAGEVREPAVREMLGVVDEGTVLRLLGKLARGDDVAGLIAMADAMAAESAPFAALLLDMARALQRIAVLQLHDRAAGASGEADAGVVGEAPTLAWLAAHVDPVDVQVWYQILLHAVRDLPLAPDPHTGFTMALCRLLAFTADAAGSTASAPAAAGQPGAAASAPRASSRPASRVEPPGAPLSFAPGSSSPQPARQAGQDRGSASPASPSPLPSAAVVAAASATPSAARLQTPAETLPETSSDFDGDWAGLAARVAASGMTGQFLQQSELLGREGRRFRLRVPIKPLADPQLVTRVGALLAKHFGHPVQLAVEVGSTSGTTAAAAAGRARDERQAKARESIERDPFVRELIDDFGATIVPDSIKPLEGNSR